MDFEHLYINGEWVPGSSGEWISVEDPAAMEIFARVPRGTPADVDRAARAAHEALPAWAALPLSERIALMEKFLTIFRSQEEDIIELEIRELGAPWSFAKSSHCEYQYTRVRSYIDLAPQVRWWKKCLSPRYTASPWASSAASPRGTIRWDRWCRRSFPRSSWGIRWC